MNLQGLPSETAEVADTSSSKVLEIILIVLSAVLGTLLTALAIIYFMKSRSYGRQIKALTESSFGSVSTDLNRNIKTLPNTNIFSNEKSNPVMNNLKVSKPDLDTQSIISSDSDDFAGLYDNPIFDVINKKNDSTGTKDDSSYI